MKLKNRNRNLSYSMVLKLSFLMLIGSPWMGLSQNLTPSTNISITKTWSQEPNGYTYPMGIFVPSGPVPEGGFPLGILLHGNGGNGPAMISQFNNPLSCHILVAPTGYQNSWNICAENSDAPDIEMINELVNNLQGYQNVNPNKIRVLGSSNGAGLANRVFIENDNPGIDLIAAIVSHLNEPQYHSGNFYKPSAETDPNSSYCAYESLATPLTTRKYLSISNDNDNIIPYSGGTSVVGVNFLPAETAAYNIAVHKGYTGGILSAGTSMGNPPITEFSYLSGAVVHIKGNAMHSTNSSQRDYLKKYLSDCDVVSSIKGAKNPLIKIYPNPTNNTLNVKLDLAYLGALYSVYGIRGNKIFSEKIFSEEILIDLGHLPEGPYLIRIEDQLIRVIKKKLF